MATTSSGFGNSALHAGQLRDDPVAAANPRFSEQAMQKMWLVIWLAKKAR